MIDQVGRGSVPPGKLEGETLLLARVLYLLHLAVILAWLLDRSQAQEATEELLQLIEKLLRPAAIALRIPGAGKLVGALDRIYRRGLLGKA